MGRGILQETDIDRFVPVIAPGVKEDGTPNDVQITATDHYWRNGGVFVDENRVYDATYVKLREVSMSYQLPSSVAARLSLWFGFDHAEWSEPVVPMPTVSRKEPTSILRYCLLV